MLRKFVIIFILLFFSVNICGCTKPTKVIIALLNACQEKTNTGEENPNDPKSLEYKQKKFTEDYAKVNNLDSTIDGMRLETVQKTVANDSKAADTYKEIDGYSNVCGIMSANNGIIINGNVAVYGGFYTQGDIQMANGAVYDEEKKPIHIHDRKLDALEDLLEAANGKPVLIAYWYQHDVDRIKERFQVREIKTSKDIEDWNAGKISAAVIHPASAGHGLNLQTGGSTIIWFGLTWSLELYQQTNARLHRQGQKETVVIHHIIAKDTIDEQVMSALRKKEKTQDALIDAVKANLGVHR